jgi:hypothetical protein
MLSVRGACVVVAVLSGEKRDSTRWDGGEKDRRQASSTLESPAHFIR